MSFWPRNAGRIRFWASQNDETVSQNDNYFRIFMTYDSIIIGSGVAGMTASIYASRYGVKHLVFGREIGGLGLLASRVENYPGYPSITGVELMENFRKQVEDHGVKIRQEEIMKIKKGEVFEVINSRKKSFKARSLILAMGAVHRQLNIPGEKELIGKGVSYCATCDGFFFKDKVAAVVGGGNSAGSSVAHLGNICQKVYLIYRKKEGQMKMESAWKRKIEKLIKAGKIEMVMETNVTKILGKDVKDVKDVEIVKDGVKNSKQLQQLQQLKQLQLPSSDKVTAVELDKPYKNSKHLPLDGVFIEIGQVPASALAADLGVKMDKFGYIETDLSSRTNVSGVFAAGDLAIIPKQVLLRQFVTAAAEGAIAAASAYQFLKGEGAPQMISGSKN